MNISSTNSTYTNYANQPSSTSKTEKSNGSFMSNLQEVSNEKRDTNTQINDLLDIEVFNNMTEEQKIEHKRNIGEEYGLIKALSFGIATSFENINMQKAVYNTFSNIPENEMLDITADIQSSTLNYLSGNGLKASYSITLDKNNQVDHGNSNIDTGAYFNNISSEEFEYLFSTLKESHDSLSSVVGSEQASKYSKVYEGILSSYKDYVNSSKNEAFYG